MLDTVEQMSSFLVGVRLNVRQMFDVFKNVSDQKNGIPTITTTTTTATTATSTITIAPTPPTTTTTNSHEKLSSLVLPYLRRASGDLSHINSLYANNVKNMENMAISAVTSASEDIPSRANKISCNQLAHQLLEEYEHVPKLEWVHESTTTSSSSGSSRNGSLGDDDDRVDDEGGEKTIEEKSENGAAQRNETKNKRKRAHSLPIDPFIKFNSGLIYSSAALTAKGTGTAAGSSEDVLPFSKRPKILSVLPKGIQPVSKSSNEVPIVRMFRPPYNINLMNYVREDLNKMKDLVTKINDSLVDLKHTPSHINIIRFMSMFNLKTPVSTLKSESSQQQQQAQQPNQLLRMVHVSVGSALHVFITVHGDRLIPIRVQAFGMDERVTGPQTMENGAACITFESEKKRMKREIEHVNLQPQEQSKHHVFVSISNCATEAIKFYRQTKELNDTPLIYLLLYLTRYNDVFMEKCAVCGRLLHLDSETSGMMPPMRSFLYGKPVHIQCVDSLE